MRRNPARAGFETSVGILLIFVSQEWNYDFFKKMSGRNFEHGPRRQPQSLHSPVNASILLDLFIYFINAPYSRDRIRSLPAGLSFLIADSVLHSQALMLSIIPSAAGCALR